MKIAIMGLSGSGKSTLAQRLGEQYKIPVLHLDTVQFLSGWQSRPLPEQLDLVRAFMREHQSWVIDGNYTNLYYDERLESADLIVLMLFNRWSRLWRVMQRLRRYQGSARPSMADGCEERLNAEFVWWVLHKGCTRKHLQHYRAVASQYAYKTVTLRNQRQLDRYIRQLQR